MKSIRMKIMLAITLCAMMAVLVVGFIGIYSSNSMLEDSAYDAEELLAENNANNLNITIGEIESSVNGLAISVVSMLDNVQQFQTNPAYVADYQEKIRPIAEEFANNTDGAMAFYVRFNPDFTEPTSGIFHADSEGDGVIEQLVPTDFSQYDPSDTAHVGWYYIPVNAGEPVWLDPYTNENIGVEMVSYVVPIFKDGVSIGVVGMDINYSLFTDTVNSIKPFENSYGSLLNANQNYLIDPNMKQTDNLADMDQSLSEKLTANQHGVTTSVINNEEKVIAYSSLSNGQYLLITSDRSDIFRDVNTLTKRILFVLAGMIILAILVALFVGNKISKPLAILIADMNKVKEGDLTVQTKIKNKDEIGEIGENFNNMVQELGLLTKNISTVSQKIHRQQRLR